MPTSNFGGFEDSRLPAGKIIMWSGAYDNIPAGWTICDGANGTPDMRHKFVKGSSSATASLGTVGQDSYTLSTAQLPSHDHGGSTVSVGDHNHEFPKKKSNPYDDYSGSYNYGYAVSHDGDEYNERGMSTQDDHEHNAPTYSTGGSSSVDNRPNYYELVFIQRI